MHKSRAVHWPTLFRVLFLDGSFHSSSSPVRSFPPARQLLCSRGTTIPRKKNSSIHRSSSHSFSHSATSRPTTSLFLTHGSALSSTASSSLSSTSDRAYCSLCSRTNHHESFNARVSGSLISGNNKPSSLIPLRKTRKSNCTATRLTIQSRHLSTSIPTSVPGPEELLLTPSVSQPPPPPTSTTIGSAASGSLSLSSSPSLPLSSLVSSTTKPRRRKKLPLTTTTTNPTSAFSIDPSTLTPVCPVALANLRYLIHTTAEPQSPFMDQSYKPKIRRKEHGRGSISDSAYYGSRLPTISSLPESTMIPPLTVIESLYRCLKLNGELWQLEAKDWQQLVHWLAHHRSYGTLTDILEYVTSRQRKGRKMSNVAMDLLANKFTSAEYAAMADAMVRTSSSSSSGSLGSISGSFARSRVAGSRMEQYFEKQPQQQGQGQGRQVSAGVAAIERVVRMMITSRIIPSRDLYRIWVREAVKSKDWISGLEAWKELQFQGGRVAATPDIRIVADVIRCQLELGKPDEAVELFMNVVDKEVLFHVRTDFRHVFSPLVFEGKGQRGGSGGAGGVGVKAGSVDGVEVLSSPSSVALENAGVDVTCGQEYVQYQRSVQNEIQWLMEKQAGSNQQVVINWKRHLYPALIESLSVVDPVAMPGVAALAQELFSDLQVMGITMDSGRFRSLVRCIGHEKSSRASEQFMEHLKLSGVVSVEKLGGSRRNHGVGRPIFEGSSVSSISPPSQSPSPSSSGLSGTALYLEVGWQQVLSQSIAESEMDRSRRVFQRMNLAGMWAGKEISEQLLTGFLELEDQSSAMSVLENMLVHKVPPSMGVTNHLIGSLVECDRLEDAQAVFRELTQTYGVIPDANAFKQLLGLAAKSGSMVMTEAIMKTVSNRGIQQDGQFFEQILKSYVGTKDLSGAIKMFRLMVRADIAHEPKHLNVLLQGAHFLSSTKTMVGIMEVMHSLGFKPNHTTWRILLQNAFRNKDDDLAEKVYAELVRRSGNDSMVASRRPRTFNILLQEYVERFGSTQGIWMLKESIESGYSRTNLNTFRILIEKCCRDQDGRLGLKVYELMRSQGRMSDQGLVILLLGQLKFEKSIDAGKKLVQDVILSGMEMNTTMVEQMIDFYSVSKELRLAFTLYMNMRRVYGLVPTVPMVESLARASVESGMLGYLRNLHFRQVQQQGYATDQQDGGDEQQPQQVDVAAVPWKEKEMVDWLRALRPGMEEFMVDFPDLQQEQEQQQQQQRQHHEQ